MTRPTLGFHLINLPLAVKHDHELALTKCRQIAYYQDFGHFRRGHRVLFAFLALSKDIDEQNEKLAICDTKIKDVVIPAMTRLESYNDRIYKLELTNVKWTLSGT
jgi:hypothetical protein